MEMEKNNIFSAFYQHEEKPETGNENWAKHENERMKMNGKRTERKTFIS